jgi:hypothetical protein
VHAREGRAVDYRLDNASAVVVVVVVVVKKKSACVFTEEDLPSCSSSYPGGDKDSPCSLAVFFTSQHPSRRLSEPRVDCAVHAPKLSPPNKKTRPAILCNHPRPYLTSSPPTECETPAHTCRASSTPVSELPFLPCIALFRERF